MSLSVVIDVVIGVAFMYVLLSLIATCLQEIVAGVFAWRGTYLAKGIDVILSNQQDAAFAFDSVRDFLVAHFTNIAPPSAAAALRQSLPVPPSASDAALLKILDLPSHPLLRGTPSALPSYVSSRNFSMAMLEVLRDGSASPLFTQAESTTAKLPEGDLRKLLGTFIQDSGGDLDKFRANIEHWFDDAMDRLSGIYKRISQYFLLAIGLLIAVALNVDSFHVVQVLWDNPDQRASIVEKAVQSTATSASNVGALVQQFEAASFPVGWKRLGNNEANLSSPEDVGTWILRIIGWLVTALAVSLGAPFWFDVLKKVMNLRNAGAVPDPANGNAGAGSSK